MSISVPKICNLALYKIGATRISNLTDDSKNAKLCNEFWEPVRDAVLRSHPWNCAIDRASIAALSDDPAFGYDHQYALPNDCLRVLRMEELSYNFSVEGRKLLTDEDSPAKIIYIKRVVDPNQYDALLVRVLWMSLALELAKPIMGKRADTSDLLADLTKLALPLARSIDGQETSLMTFETNTFLEARL